MKYFKPIFILALFQVSFSLQAQWVDSASASFNNDTLTIHIEGDIFVRDPKGLKSISDTIVADSVLVDVFFLPCSPFQLLAPYDTTFSVTGNFSPGLNHLRLYTILHEDTIGSCYTSNGNEYFDTVNIAFNVPLSNEEFKSEKSVHIYPNPANDIVLLENVSSLQKIEILEPGGKKIKTLSFVGNQFDVSDLSPGVYILHFYLDGFTETHKLLKL